MQSYSQKEYNITRSNAHADQAEAGDDRSSSDQHAARPEVTENAKDTVTQNVSTFKYCKEETHLDIVQSKRGFYGRKYGSEQITKPLVKKFNAQQRDSKSPFREHGKPPLAYFLPVPICQLLVSMRDTQDRGLFKWFAHDLQANGQTISRKASRK